MRLDLFLKTSRIIKRRVIAKEVILAGHVKVNGKTAAPATNIKENDVILIKIAKKLWEVKVLSVDESKLRKTPLECYEMSEVNDQ
jgi:ribosomal 50S subunit-recycling heat shock protein